ncbi:MetQ/NlpA family ABC transporter substrate-binding protein [Fusobacterium necrophorum]|uniref:MetQ/NlpA family ABC transporter substrate-binding protein n=1 Tax=Fusobacterium necrophorum TaxID=859 RepID=UPI000D135214|nr:MetQ/NlpA family ABC transporter substrate-binding protein [Fusobacterium necrophorum]AVQ20579.1 methionine ABC transporter substrate-binding protein [Fusobacterium necrophorum subsp. funduliforme]MBR8722659.1 Membrane lipoprotein TpN32 [Fusobacterium necrophorum subsp. funduliforme]MDK4521562.1 MetQ/NlpA family ABC transporter substrate-binding protein [Fusobacterium necrophorum]
MLKKLITIGSFVVVSSLALAGTLKVGASPVPHAELLNFVKADLQKQGVDLKIVEFTDYVTPNLALSDGELDANFFQHLPYLQKFASERNLKLSAAGKVHVEPIGLYSKKATSLKNLKKGATIAIPNDPSNGGRALILLHNKKLLVLKDPKNLYTTEFDIIKNPNNFKFKAVEAAQLPRVLSDVDAALINGNYALESGLNPSKDALLLEGEESPYANIIAVKTGKEKNADIQKLLKALHDPKVKEFINKQYKGGVVAAF